MQQRIEPLLPETEPFLLDDWLVEPVLNRVRRGDEAQQLEHKAMDVLLCLAARPGELVTKRELVDAVWQTEFVSENTLTRRIADLREALGDDARRPRYIETVTKRGYRLVASVATGSEERFSPTDPEPGRSPRRVTAATPPEPVTGVARL